MVWFGLVWFGLAWAGGALVIIYKIEMLLSTLVQCDNCSGYCPTNWVTTTTHGGRLCGTGCALEWIGKHQPIEEKKEESNGSRLRKLVRMLNRIFSSV